MKSTTDPRHLKRAKIVQYLFASSFSKKSISHRSVIIQPIHKLITKIDPIIEESAPQFPIDKISKIDVAILRLAVYELLFVKVEPKKVIIDEAVELAKEFGGDKSPSFVNGVLGNVDKKYSQI